MTQIDTIHSDKPVRLFDQDAPTLYDWESDVSIDAELLQDETLWDDSSMYTDSLTDDSESQIEYNDEDTHSENRLSRHAIGLGLGAAGLATAYMGARHPELSQSLIKSNAEDGTLASGLLIGSHSGGMETATIPVTTARIAFDGLKEVFKRWRSADLKEKITSPVKGSVAWANLIFGEAMAIGVQGYLQAGNSSNIRSFLFGAGAALAIETGFSLEKARHNKVKQPAEIVAEAVAIAPWLGGAMAVENKKLPLRQAPYAIGGYMIFGTALAAAAEYNNLAAKAINQKGIIIPTLVAYGVVKKVHEYFGYKGTLDKAADKTVNVLGKVKSRYSRE